jgi:hypothetical protein
LNTRTIASIVGSRSSRLVKSSRASAGCGLAPRPPATKTRNPASVEPSSRVRVVAITPTSLNIAWPQSVSQPEKLILNLRGRRWFERVAQEVPVGGLGPWADVEVLFRAGAGEVAAHDVAHGVAARLAGGEPDRGQVSHDLGDPLQLHEVELDVLASGDVAPAPGVLIGDVGHHVELLGGDAAVGQLHPHHLVVAALALAVDAVVEAEHPEHVLVDLAGEVAGQARSNLSMSACWPGSTGTGDTGAIVDSRWSMGMTLRWDRLKYDSGGQQYLYDRKS